MKITPDMPVWAWIGRHATWLLSRYAVRPSGRTAYEETFDSSYSSEIGVFGESMYMKGMLYAARLDVRSVCFKTEKPEDPPRAPALG